MALTEISRLRASYIGDYLGEVIKGILGVWTNYRQNQHPSALGYRVQGLYNGKGLGCSQIQTGRVKGLHKLEGFRVLCKRVKGLYKLEGYRILRLVLFVCHGIRTHHEESGVSFVGHAVDGENLAPPYIDAGARFFLRPP